MSKVERALAWTIRQCGQFVRDLGQFIFTCPKSRQEKLWRRANLLLGAGVFTLVVCTLILAIFMS